MFDACIHWKVQNRSISRVLHDSDTCSRVSDLDTKYSLNACRSNRPKYKLRSTVFSHSRISIEISTANDTRALTPYLTVYNDVKLIIVFFFEHGHTLLQRLSLTKQMEFLLRCIFEKRKKQESYTIPFFDFDVKSRSFLKKSSVSRENNREKDSSNNTKQRWVSVTAQECTE